MGSKMKSFFEDPDHPSEVDPFDEFVQEVDELLGELEPDLLDLNSETMQTFEAKPAATDSIQSLAERAMPVALGDDYQEMRETFMAIMQQVLRPVTRYIKAVINGVEDRELFEVMNFTVTPLIDKVEQVELFQHTSRLLEFRAILTRILGTHFGTLSDDMRQELVSTYMEIKEAFNLEFRGNQRAVQNILQFYKLLCFNRDVDADLIRRFFAVGISSVTWVRRSPLDEICSLSGMKEEEARLLKTLAQNYREPNDDMMPSLRREGALVPYH